MLSEDSGGEKSDKDKGGGGVEFPQEVSAAARAAFSSGQARAFSLDKAGIYYDGGTSQGCVLAVPVRVPAPDLSRHPAEFVSIHETAATDATTPIDTGFTRGLL